MQRSGDYLERAVQRHYLATRKGAHDRGVSWSLSFDDFAKLWLDSGRFNDRSTGPGGPHLRRRDRWKGYELSNVYIYIPGEIAPTPAPLEPTAEVLRVAGLLRCSRFAPHALVGQTIQQLRQEMVLAGVPFAQAQSRAADLVRQAVAHLGLELPSGDDLRADGKIIASRRASVAEPSTS